MLLDGNHGGIRKNKTPESAFRGSWQFSHHRAATGSGGSNANQALAGASAGASSFFAAAARRARLIMPRMVSVGVAPLPIQ